MARSTAASRRSIQSRETGCKEIVKVPPFEVASRIEASWQESEGPQEIESSAEKVLKRSQFLSPFPQYNFLSSNDD